MSESKRKREGKVRHILEEKGMSCLQGKGRVSRRKGAAPFRNGFRPSRIIHLSVLIYLGILLATGT